MLGRPTVTAASELLYRFAGSCRTAVDTSMCSGSLRLSIRGLFDMHWESYGGDARLVWWFWFRACDGSFCAETGSTPGPAARQLEQRRGVLPVVRSAARSFRRPARIDLGFRLALSPSGGEPEVGKEK